MVLKDGERPSAAVAQTTPGTTSQVMTEFELALVGLWHTFSRWVERCADASGSQGLSSLDLLVLHFLIYRARSMRAADIAFALSIEDTHLVSYSLKKLVRLGLMDTRRSGKEILYTPTESNETSFNRYVDVRQAYLISAIELLQKPGYDLAALTGMLRALSGVYEQAARSAAQVRDAAPAPIADASSKNRASARPS